MQRGDELPPGVMKMVKVFVAVKRKLQPGDRWPAVTATRASSRASSPEEDMPHLEDGTPVDHRAQPLGVPSRMNVGQILRPIWAGPAPAWAARSARWSTRCARTAMRPSSAST